MTWPLCTFLPPTHNNKHCSTQGGGRWQKIWVYQRPNCFKEGPVHKKLAWISSQILFFKLEKGCGFLTLFFCLAHFSYLVSDITVLQTRFSPLPIGVHRNKQYPHNRWAPRTWRGGALECLTSVSRIFLLQLLAMKYFFFMYGFYWTKIFINIQCTEYDYHIFVEFSL